MGISFSSIYPPDPHAHTYIYQVTRSSSNITGGPEEVIERERNYADMSTNENY